MTIKEWGNIDGTAVGKQFIEKAEPTVDRTTTADSGVAVHEDFNKLLFPQRIPSPFNIKTIHHFDVWVMLGRITIRHADEVAFLCSTLPCTFLIKILKGTILSVYTSYISNFIFTVIDRILLFFFFCKHWLSSISQFK